MTKMRKIAPFPRDWGRLHERGNKRVILSQKKPGTAQGKAEQVLVYTHSAEYMKEKTCIQELIFQPSACIAEKMRCMKIAGQFDRITLVCRQERQNYLAPALFRTCSA
jgi:hypothetical protein